MIAYMGNVPHNGFLSTLAEVFRKRSHPRRLNLASPTTTVALAENSKARERVKYNVEEFDTYFELCRGIYYAVSDSHRDFDYAVNFLNAFKKELFATPYLPFSADQLKQISSLVDQVNTLCQLHKQIEGEKNLDTRKRLESRLREKEIFLIKDAPACLAEWLDRDLIEEVWEGREREAARLYPDDSEARANYLERY